MRKAVSDRPGPGARWYRQPIIWLVFALFAAVVASCIAMIVLGARHADEPLPDVGEQVFKVPVSRQPAKDPD